MDSPSGRLRNYLADQLEECTDGDVVAYSTLCTHMGCSIGGQVDPDRATAGPCP